MKKNWTVLGVIVLGMFLFTGCSSSMERDARKAAKLTCEYMEYLNKGDFEAAQAMETSELPDFQKMIEEKYDFDDAEWLSEWKKALDKELKRLDCGVSLDDLW